MLLDINHIYVSVFVCITIHLPSCDEYSHLFIIVIIQKGNPVVINLIVNI